MPVHVVLLRGINLGSKRRVAMSDLRELLGELGYADVRTHLQSGNAVFRTPLRSADEVGKQVEKAIAARLGMTVDVVVRSAAQLAKVVAHDPFGGTASDPARYMVVFLDRKPPAGWLAGIDPDSYAPEQVATLGREIYLWLPDGAHDSKLARAVGGSKVGGTATMRNWNVVTKLADLAADL
ncbi:MAG: hypothetical protein QOE01_2638 [Actinomycetota bacterium]|jgi:uncharacterized protein (DUF1697 family)|nr:hypothetical protein [Actinomycetota bacterium]